METPDYEVIQLKDGSLLTGDLASRVQNFSFVEGLCAADHEYPLKPRDRHYYHALVITPLLQEGKIDDGTKTPFDDRKLRVDGISISDDTLEVALGISHFHVFRADQRRSDEENLALQERGKRDFNDRWAYLQRNPGVAGLVLSINGSVYGGKRTNPDQTGAFNSVAGHLRYRDDVQEVNITDDLDRELREEMGINKEDVISRRFVGAYGNPIKGDFDFAWIVQTSLSDDYFNRDGPWREQRKTKEHEELLRLATPVEVQSLVEEGRIPGRVEQFQIMYSTRGALLSLQESDFKVPS